MVQYHDSRITESKIFVYFIRLHEYFKKYSAIFFISLRGQYLVGMGRMLKNSPEYLPSDNRPEFE